MSYVEVKKGSSKKDYEHNLDVAISELKKKMKKENVFQELKRREYYMKPSEKRKFRKQEAFRRRIRENRKREWYENKE